MRILYSHRIQSRDGQSVHVEELIAAFRQAGHEVRVVGPGFYDAGDFGGESRVVARLRALLPAALHEVAELAYNIPAYRRLRRACREFQPDLIYERYNLYYLAGALLSRRRRHPALPGGQRAHRGGAGALQRIALETAGARAGAVGLALGGARAGGDRRARAHGGRRGRRAAPRRGRSRTASTQGVSPRCRAAGYSEKPLVLGFVGFVRSWHGLDAVIRAMAAHDADPRTAPGGGGRRAGAARARGPDRGPRYRRSRRVHRARRARRGARAGRRVRHRPAAEGGRPTPRR